MKQSLPILVTTSGWIPFKLTRITDFRKDKISIGDTGTILRDDENWHY